MKIPTFHYPTPVRPSIKRKLEALDPEGQLPSKRPRSQPPVLQWLERVAPPQEGLSPTPTRSQSVFTDFGDGASFKTTSGRPQSVPAKFDGPLSLNLQCPLNALKFPVSTNDMEDRRSSQGRADNISQDSQDSNQTRKTRRIEISPSDARYRSALKYNHIHLDTTGLEMLEEVRVFVKENILEKERKSSPQMAQQELNNVARSMASRTNSTEAVVSSLLNTPLFPIQQPDLGVGGNSSFPVTALPYNAEYGTALSAPKPGYTVGYPVNFHAPWSAQEARVVDHPYATDYTCPVPGNSVPFFILELKPDATDGALWNAENQAAGSGTYCVKAMQWLMDKAEPAQNSSALDTIAFSVAANTRHVVFYVHYYDKKIEKFVMSYVQSCIITDPKDVQKCRNMVKNITDFGLKVRLKTLRNCLGKLYHQTGSWPNKHAASAADSPGQRESLTLATSMTTPSSVGTRASSREPKIRW